MTLYRHPAFRTPFTNHITSRRELHFGGGTHAPNNHGLNAITANTSSAGGVGGMGKKGWAIPQARLTLLNRVSRARKVIANDIA